MLPRGRRFPLPTMTETGGIFSGVSPGMSMVIVIVGLTGLFQLANSVAKFIALFREQPKPSETYVRITEFSEHRAMILAQLASARTARDADRAETARMFSELQRELREDLRAVHARIDDLPSQLIATLRNTGALDK